MGSMTAPPRAGSAACTSSAAMNSIPSVLVTGASRGLGRGVAVAAAAEGLSVAINYASNRAAADETAALCRAAAPGAEQRFVPLRADVSRPRERADLTEATEESFEEVVRTNLQGPHFLTQRVARHWLEQGYAPALPGGFKIVFITSISADTASVNRGEYCMSKAGLAMASQLWAVRLAAENIQVLELRPGIMATDMTAGVKDRYDRLIAEGLVPQRRWGSAEDVGRAVRAVLAGHLPFTTGDVIHLDGGFHLRRL